MLVEGAECIACSRMVLKDPAGSRATLGPGRSRVKVAPASDPLSCQSRNEHTYQQG